MRKLLTVVTTIGLWATLGGSALALPSNAPDATAQTDGIVRAIAQAGNLIWVGGQFSHVKDSNGATVATVSDIAAFDATTGANATPSTVASLTGSDSIVYDLSYDPGTNTLYAGGLFTAGTAKNLVALDATTGAIKKSFSAPKLFSVLASGANVYGGGAALNAWVASTAKKLAGFTPPKAVIDASIRGHATAPIFRDLVAYGGSVVSACQCDSLTWSGTSYPTKALVKVDASTGQPQLWSSDGLYSPSGLKSDQANAAGFGISLYYDAASDALYLAAGGSDFADRFVASTGAAVWHTDTSGSSQAITMFEGEVIDGGHFRWVARTNGQDCGDNAHPNFGCIFQPRLVALDPATGVVTPAYTTETTSGGLTRYMERGWGPAICCAYNGTWAITPTTNGLWVGGEITTMGTGWNVDAAATAALPALKYVLNPSQHGGVGRFT